MVHEEIGFLARVATVALTPIILFYAWAALHSEYAAKSRAEKGSFWHILLAAFLLGVGELADVYGTASGEPHAAAVASIARLAVFVLFLSFIRRKLRESVKEQLQGKSDAVQSKKAGKMS